jgi:hypothetical protein
MRIVIECDDGLVTRVVSDTSIDAEVIVLDWDRRDEPRKETAEFLWTYRHVLRQTGPRISHHTSPGEASMSYELREDLFPHALS